MKYLIMCEGPNEVAIMNILIENNLLLFDRDDLLDLRVFHARQIKNNAAVKTALNIYSGDVKVLRIGDTLNDTLKIPKDYKEKIICVEDYHTKPELEILLIISENLVKDYNKTKSKKLPKQYSKEKIKCNGKRYDNSTNFFERYFSDCDKLVSAIENYHSIHKHKKDEYCLHAILKNK